MPKKPIRTWWWVLWLTRAVKSSSSCDLRSNWDFNLAYCCATLTLRVSCSITVVRRASTDAWEVGFLKGVDVKNGFKTYKLLFGVLQLLKLRENRWAWWRRASGQSTSWIVNIAIEGDRLGADSVVKGHLSTGNYFVLQILRPISNQLGHLRGLANKSRAENVLHGGGHLEYNYKYLSAQT